MNLIVVGTNHKYSPIQLRERLTFSKNRLKDSLLILKERNVLKGAVILSTCNRVEIYASTADIEKGIEEIKCFISRFQEIEERRFSPYLYIYEAEEALKHLLVVACGLDSLILGETQILGQVKFALSIACDIGFVDELLKKIFTASLSFAKKIHHQTKLSEGKISVGSVAIDFIKEKLGGLSGKNILIIGVGKVTELVLQYLKKEKLKVVFISNRTYQKAKELAAQIGALAVRFDNLKQFLKEADVVISATSSPHFIIKKDTLEGLNKDGLLILDLALPRDVDPRIKQIKNFSLYTLEDLDALIKKNMDKKSKEAKQVNELIDIEVKKLWPRIQNYKEEFTKLAPALAYLP